MGSDPVATHLDGLDAAAATEALMRCCGCTRWAQAMVAARPFETDAEVFAKAETLWAEASREHVLEALSHHPQIGADLDSLRAKFASTATWSSGEQSAVNEADEATLVALRDGNRAYADKFGHIFVVCATGKSAAQMLALLQERLPNDPEPELAIAAAEQGKITTLRLQKLVSS